MSGSSYEANQEGGAGAGRVDFAGRSVGSVVVGVFGRSWDLSSRTLALWPSRLSAQHPTNVPRKSQESSLRVNSTL